MTSFDDQLERGMGEALADIAGARTPNYINSAIADAVSHRQRRWWTFPERWIPMSVVTGNRSVAPVVPWRPIALLVILGLLLALTFAFAAGNLLHRNATPFGLATNGALVYALAGDVYTADEFGGNERAIIAGPESDSDPWFSHDGSKIAFIRTAGSVETLMMADADGSHVLPLMAGDFFAADWSPDSSEIAVISGASDLAELWIVSADTEATARQIVFDSITPYSWAAWRPPAGHEILFQAVDDRTQLPGLYTVNADGTGIRSLVIADDTDPGLNFQGVHLSHDGNVVGYSNWEPNAAGQEDAWGHVYNIETGADRQSLEYSTPHFSPDGSFVVGEGVFQLLYGPVDGHEPARAIGPKYDNQRSTGYDFSPDGKQVLLTTDVSHQTYFIDVASGAATQTTWKTADFPGWQRLPR